MPAILTNRMEALKAALAALYPLRVVTRDAVDPALQKREDLVKGIYTLIAFGEQGYTNVSGYVAQDAQQRILINADFELDAPNNKGVHVEDMENTMRDEIVAFAQSIDNDQALCALHLIGWRQSGQIFAPRGWALFELEYIP